MIKKIFFIYLFISSFSCLFSLDSIAATRTWDGGAGTNDFNTAANWSSDILPTSADSCVIMSSSVSLTITLSANITIGALNIYMNKKDQFIYFDVVSSRLTILGNLHVKSKGNNSFVVLDLGTTNCGITVNRHTFLDDFGGNSDVAVYADATPGFLNMNGNVTLGPDAWTSSGNEPNITLDGVSNQLITTNNVSYFVTQNYTIGSVNNPTITLAGAYNTIQPRDGDFTINGTSTFDLGSLGDVIDRLTVGGTFTMAAGSTLKIGGTGDFPASYSNYSISPTSNTYYNGTTQSVTAVSGGYGNLFIEGAGSTKTLAASTVDVNGNLTITSGTLAASSFLMTLAGNFTNNSTYTCGTGTITFDGTSNQNITGSSVSTLYRMTVNNSAGVSVLKGATVTNLLTFTSGNITAATSTEPLKLDVSASVSGNGDGKCVVGYCSKNTNTTSKFTFPVGTSSTQRLMSITPSTTSATTWLVKYFSSGYSDASITGVDMETVSSSEYWTVDRVGASNATIELTWNAASGITDVSKVWVAHYNGSDWETASSEGGSGNLSAGVKSSSSNWSSYSPFTFGFSPDGTVLPIELISFSAKKLKNDVLVSWKTASEINNDYFTVERSFDGQHFTPIARIDGAGNSTHTIDYKIEDKDYVNGVNYYKLIQTDYNGDETVSDIVAVDMTTNSEAKIKTVNLIGQEVNEHFSGIVYDVYSDGSLVKRMQ
jgi:hypothetical protein